MPATVTAARFAPGTRWSKVTAQGMSSAGATSVDVLTVIHGLTRSPTRVSLVVRSVLGTPSGGVPVPVLDTVNGSVVTLRLPASDGGATAIQVDVVCETEHSFVS